MLKKYNTIRIINTIIDLFLFLFILNNVNCIAIVYYLFLYTKRENASHKNYY